MSHSIPTSSFVEESALIRAPLAKVWHLIKLQHFDKLWPSAIKKAEHVPSSSSESSEEALIVRWTFKDGNVLDVKQDEHSSIKHSITYSVVSAEPSLSYSSVVSTITCHPVTSGEFEGSTLVTFTGNFSSDADAGVIQDGKFKRREALGDLAKVAEKA